MLLWYNPCRLKEVLARRRDRDFIIIVMFGIFCDPPEDDCRSHHELWIISYFNSGFSSKLWYINHIFYTFLAQTLLGELLDRDVSSCEELNIPLVPTLENNIKSYIYIYLHNLFDLVEHWSPPSAFLMRLPLKNCCIIFLESISLQEKWILMSKVSKQSFQPT